MRLPTSSDSAADSVKEAEAGFVETVTTVPRLVLQKSVLGQSTSPQPPPGFVMSGAHDAGSDGVVVTAITAPVVRALPTATHRFSAGQSTALQTERPRQRPGPSGPAALRQRGLQARGRGPSGAAERRTRGIQAHRGARRHAQRRTDGLPEQSGLPYSRLQSALVVAAAVTPCPRRFGWNGPAVFSSRSEVLKTPLMYESLAQ